jgi:hypothetical protein
MAITKENIERTVQKFRDDLNTEGSTLNDAKTKFIAGALIAEAKKKKFKDDPGALAAERERLTQQFDTQVLDAVRRGATNGGKPDLYTSADSSISDKIGENIGRGALSFLPFGLGGLMSFLGLDNLIDFGNITDTVKEWVGIAPKYNADQKAMAGALTELQKNPVSFGVGSVFVLDQQSAASMYDQSASPAANSTEVVKNDAPIVLTAEQKQEAQRIKDQMAQMNASGAQSHDGDPNPGSTMLASNTNPAANRNT